MEASVDGICSEDFAERARINQSKLSSEMKSQYDFIICGSGSSGSVVARRLAENPAVSVLLIEAGGEDNVPSVNEPGQWFLNLGSERDWNFSAEPNPHLNGRVIPMNMGKVLGGGSSINVMAWMRGHRNDWDFFAGEAADPAWSYESILGIYRRIEDWQGVPDPDRRGVGGPVFVQPAPDPHPIASATLEAARSVGIPTFDSPNGRMMEGEGGCSIIDVLIRNGRRRSVFRAYTFPYMDRPNLTVLSQAQVTKVTFKGRRATGVEFAHKGKHFRIGAGREIVLSLGAINTPKVLMHSGIGDRSALRSFGIPVVQHLPGVGQNFQDHAGIGCLWEHPDFPAAWNNAAEVTFFWKSASGVERRTCKPAKARYQCPASRPPPGLPRPPNPGRCWRVSSGRRAGAGCICQDQIRTIPCGSRPTCCRIPTTSRPR
jgi:choline dehydrogenase